MSDENKIRKAVMQREITRLCHFTSSRNLGHIMTDNRGILATQNLQDDKEKVLNPNDVRRLDGYPDHICCSVEYPNVYFFTKARERARERDPACFPDWVVLFIRPDYLWASGTLFSPINAATAGSESREGFDSFNGLFAREVKGKRTRFRTNNHPKFLPTDAQAEVLIPHHIPREHLLGIGAADKSQAKRVIVHLGLLKAPIPRILVSKSLFCLAPFHKMLNSGMRPDEQEYTREDNGQS